MVTKNFNILNYKILKKNVLHKFNEYNIEEMQNKIKKYIDY